MTANGNDSERLVGRIDNQYSRGTGMTQIFYDTTCINCGSSVSTINQGDSVTVVCGCCTGTAENFKEACSLWERATQERLKARMKK